MGCGSIFPHESFVRGDITMLTRCVHISGLTVPEDRVRRRSAPHRVVGIKSDPLPGCRVLGAKLLVAVVIVAEAASFHVRSVDIVESVVS